MIKNEALGVFGGTFDPIHLGHIQPLSDAARITGIKQIKLIPCHIPPHKGVPRVSPQQRLEMVNIATQNNPLFSVDDREIRLRRPSYSVHTLTDLRQEHPDIPLCFFMGMDSLCSFNRWFQYQQILKLCHLVVMQRPQYPMIFNEAVSALLAKHQSEDIHDLHSTLSGAIYIAQTNQLDISATQLRQSINNPNINKLVDSAVLDYIKAHQLYR